MDECGYVRCGGWCDARCVAAVHELGLGLSPSSLSLLQTPLLRDGRAKMHGLRQALMRVIL